jgi:hypothetical protein
MEKGLLVLRTPLFYACISSVEFGLHEDPPTTARIESDGASSMKKRMPYSLIAYGDPTRTKAMVTWDKRLNPMFVEFLFLYCSCSARIGGETLVLTIQAQVPLAAVAETVVVAHVIEEVVELGILVLAVGGPKETACHGEKSATTIAHTVEGFASAGRKAGAAVGAVVGPESAIRVIDGNLFFFRDQGGFLTAERALMLRQDVNGVVDLPPLAVVARIVVLVIEKDLDNVVGLDRDNRGEESQGEEEKGNGEVHFEQQYLCRGRTFCVIFLFRSRFTDGRMHRAG